MKQMISIREFRGELSGVLDGKKPILLTSHGHAKAMIYPLEAGAEVPMDVKRDAFQILAQQISKKTADIDEKEMLRDFEAWRKQRRRSRR